MRRPRQTLRGGDGAGFFRRRDGDLSREDRADLLQFQAYVRGRISEMSQRMPPRMGTREQVELSFLEEQVVEDSMPSRKRKLRDPLKGTPLKDISMTNL